MSMDSHTSTLLADGVGIDRALGFHLAVRVFPARPEMFGVAKRAIRRYNEGQPERRVRLPEGVTHARYGRLVPAELVIKHLNLWCFLDNDEDGE